MTTIERATAADADAILALLDRHGLPRAGLLPHLATTLVAKCDAAIVGSAALEMYPQGALLRSVAVAADWQHAGLGTRLTGAALDLARDSRVPAVYLLTTTAAQFFPRFGFTPIERRDVPLDVRQSVEFVSACPESAVVMKRLLE